jgi:hypothetical protein
MRKEVREGENSAGLKPYFSGSFADLVPCFTFFVFDTFAFLGGRQDQDGCKKAAAGNG